jgi:hypothetical protein
VSDWREVPAVPVTAFKHADLVVAGLPEGKTFLTSGTTQGGESRGRHRVPDPEIYRAAALAHFERCVLPDGVRPRFAVLAPSLAEQPQSSLCQMIDWLAASFGLASPEYFVVSGELDAGAFERRLHTFELGDEPGGTPGLPYSDYTGYTPANEPMDIRLPFDPTTVHDPNAWQRLRYVDASGNVVTPGFVGAQWQRVTTFALSPGTLRSPTGPAKYGSADYLDQAQALLDLSAGLTDEQKMIAEYWADGPHSELPPGHWNLFAQFVSRRDHHGVQAHGLERDVKLFFALTNAVADAGCCAWDNKRAFNSVRPITAIRTLFRGQMVRAWAGPYQGTKLVDGAAWFPYQPTTFPTPPFPEYSSGHSNFSAAGAEILKRFTHNDRFGASVTLPAGSSRTEPGAVPSSDVTLSWSTFSDAANEAGISRRYGGIHFEQGDLDGRATGRLAARSAWKRAQHYWRAI